MGKITFSVFGLLFAVTGLWAQTTYSTGIVTFFGGGPSLAYSGKVDVTSTTVTVTLIGPSNRWLGIAFNVTGPNQMNNLGSDVLIFNGTNMTDRSFNGQAEPPLDTQNWTVTSNTVSSGVRTVSATRSRVAAESTDYTFPLAAQPLDLTYARGEDLMIVFHGFGNCGSTVSNLAIDGFDLERFKVYPNPAHDFVKIELQDAVFEADILIYDVQGRKVKEVKVTLENNKVDVTGLNCGSYLMKIKTEKGEGTKTLVIY
ncbi:MULTISPECIES: T9SS type A sorting domain-containing protein [Flavobacterium]|uniref:T9SS type A sorting domain-containing protein n=1 Tax=Flavobacterium TaxID=237 RepID=UPI001FCCAF9E|nr:MULTISPECIES: T9SS type A sorting domain-containing protein [Flavobacterium]UOK42456.1 T9SS type A sorting domain-containing protein [Flavobacterium enshiense]